MYARLSTVLTPDQLRIVCDNHANVEESIKSARSSLNKLCHQPLIKDLCAPRTKLKPVETFRALLATLEAVVGDDEPLMSATAIALRACRDLLLATDSLVGRHGHPAAHDALIMRDVVGHPGTLDTLAKDSDHTTRMVDGVVYTILTPRRAHFGAAGTLFKPMALARIGTVASDPEKTIEEFRTATMAANTGDFLRIATYSMLQALGHNDAAAKIPEPERLALSRVWGLVDEEISLCVREDDVQSLIKFNLFVHVEKDRKTGGRLYQMAPEFTDLMWGRLACFLEPTDLEFFLVNMERSVALMTETAEQGEFLYFHLDQLDGPAESKRNAADSLGTIDHAATKRPCRRESTV